MDDKKFWEIVRELNWPDTHYYEAQYRFMRTHSLQEAEEFREQFMEKRRDLAQASGEQMCCDSWDDTLAHIIGLGEAEYKQNLEKPRLILEREQKWDYVESFSYCIPFPDDYGKLTDEGFTHLIEETKRLVDELESTEEDEIPPKEYRRYPSIIEVANLLIERKWQEAVDAYHTHFGPGYADDWPLHGYLIPNFIAELKRYRLREEPNPKKAETKGR